MTAADALDLLALPCATVATAAFAWLCAHAATYFRERTHNERLARLADATGRVAGDIADRLGELPAGADYKTVKDQLIKIGVADAQERYGATIASLGGASVSAITTMVRDGLQRLPAPVIAVPVSPGPDPIPGRGSLRSAT
jgi:hypothetical protein